MALVVLIVIAVLIVAAVAVFDRRYGARIRGSWSSAAGRLGLTWQAPVGRGGPGAIVGVREGHRIQVRLIEQTLSTNPPRKRTATEIRADLAQPLGLGLVVGRRREGGQAGMEAALLPRVGVGDSAFIDTLIVGARETARAEQFLDLEMREALLGAEAALGAFALYDSHVLCVRDQIVESADQIVALVEAQLSLAKALSSRR